MASTTDAESKVRLNWGVGAKVEIYSNSKSKWFVGDVAQIFTDTEGEWLEIRYDSTMSKQVQRYSTDIRPIKTARSPTKTTEGSPPSAAESPTNGELPFPPGEMERRTAWTKGHHCEIFSNTHQEWYLGEIVDIVKDDEGEWLNVVWQRANGEAMSKQVQRFSTDVRPPQNEPAAEKKPPKPKSTSTLPSRNGFMRRAPPFSRTLKSSTFSYPATQQFRRSKKLNDINEEDQRSKGGRPVDIQQWRPGHVKDWMDSLGAVYGKYKKKFSTMTGLDLVQLGEDNLKKMGLPKLHRLKLLLEIGRHNDSDTSVLRETGSVDVLNWDVGRVRKWVLEQPAPLAQYAQKFEQHGVDGVLLFHLEEDDLQTIGIKLHRKRVLEMIKAYSRTVFPDDEEQKEEEQRKPPSRMKRSRNSSRRMSRQLSAEEILAPDINQSDLLDLLSDMSDLICGVSELFAEPFQQKARALQAKTEEFMARYTAQSGGEYGPPEAANNTGHASGADGALTPRKRKKGHNPDEEEVLTNTPTSESGTWLATLQSRTGHKRRSSLVMDQSHLAGLEEDDDYVDEDDISDIE